MFQSKLLHYLNTKFVLFSDLLAENDQKSLRGYSSEKFLRCIILECGTTWEYPSTLCMYFLYTSFNLVESFRISLRSITSFGASIDTCSFVVNTWLEFAIFAGKENTKIQQSSVIFLSVNKIIPFSNVKPTTSHY